MGTTYLSEEIYTHEYLWRAAETLRDLASSQERQVYLYLPCLTMAYLAFEAFVNFIGEVLCPDLWADEKTAFRGQGDMIEAKIAAIIRELPGYEWKKGAPPYQFIKRLKHFRDVVAHGKVVRSEYVTTENEDGSHIRWTHAWDEFLEASSVERAMSSIKGFCQSLLLEARKHSDEPHLVFDAFSGSLASAEGSSKLE
jgi:hypothetical protein